MRSISRGTLSCCWVLGAARALLLGTLLLLGVSISFPAGAVPRDQTGSVAELELRVRDLEAYVNNGTRAQAENSRVPGPGPGHNGWMMVSTALVLFMTLPGLALFYGGLVRRKNVLSVMAHCLGISGLVTLLWWMGGYSFCFAPGSPLLGDLRFALLRGVGHAPPTDYTSWISHNVFACYELMFALITPALIVGAVAERVKFGALMLFLGGWMLLVYFPLAHMVWGVDGLMNGAYNPRASIKAIDFAGGTVVHASSGWSALVLALLVGRRKGFPQASFTPHSLVLTVIGTGMLWVGWYGFNAGSALAADRIAATAFVATTLAAAVGGLGWALLEWLTRGRPTVLGFCSGIVGGLVMITPAAGFVGPGSSVLLGLAGGVLPFLACTRLKNWLGYDDALDTFGVHGIAGTAGALLTGLLASTEVNPNLETNLRELVGRSLWLEQLKATGVAIALAVIGTALLGYALKATIGLRPDPESEEAGLDLTEHEERGYHLAE